MNLVLATNNDDKIKEIKYLLEDLPITVFSHNDFLEFPDVEETGQTLKENAILKAKTIAEYCDMPALADDTGLEVEALDGAPGIFSSRYAGSNASYADNINKLIDEMSKVPKEKRTASFRCVIAIDWNDGNIETVEGVCQGFICEDVQGTKGFGYDPVFYYPPKNKRFSEMTIEEKNMVSHRGLALQNMVGLIMEKVNKLRAAQSGK